MQKQRVKTSMSVPEMGKMLGLGKVESYWLVKKNYFKTIQVAGRMRVMLDSFEDWYAGQFHYKKVDGTPPGEKWRHTTMSVPEMADLLGLKSGTAYDLVKRGYFETTLIDRRRNGWRCCTVSSTRTASVFPLNGNGLPRLASRSRILSPRPPSASVRQGNSRWRISIAPYPSCRSAPPRWTTDCSPSFWIRTAVSL